MNLDKYIRENGIPHAEFAGRVGCSIATLWRIRSGKVLPGLKVFAAILDETKSVVSLADFGL